MGSFFSSSNSVSKPSDLEEDGLSYQSKNFKTRNTKQCSKKCLLLIGNAGSGKSSFVNSMYTAVLGDYTERAKSGGPAGHVSKIFKKYDLSQGEHEPSTKMFKKDQLPVVYDMPGLPPNSSVSKRFEEVLKVILRGRLPVGTNVLNLLSNEEEEIPECDDGEPIDRVVFVADASEELPSVFCDSVMKVCEEVMGAEITVFGILTKWDQLTTTVERKQKYDKFLEMIHACNTPYKALNVSNYCSDVCGDSPANWQNYNKIDIPILAFLAEICRPEYNPHS